MNIRTLSLCVLASVVFSQTSQAAFTIAHTEIANAQILSSAGVAPTAGGVSVGFFNTVVANSIFNSITSYAGLLAAGYKDVRSLPGASFGTVDWDFGLPVSGTVSNLSTTDLASGTQLYVIAFNAGNFANGFSGSTEWAVIKDDNNISPADLGNKATALTSVISSEVLFGTDNGNNVNMTAIAIPEPSRALLGMIGLGALFIRRRR